MTFFKSAALSAILLILAGSTAVRGEPQPGGIASGELGSPNLNGSCGEPFAFSAQHQEFPLTIVNGYVFVAARIHGTPGKLMFDTGTREALVLNDHLLQQLGPGTANGEGHVGSGQKYTKVIRKCVEGVEIPSGAPSADIPNVQSNDLGFIEQHITPDFLGFLGFGAYPNYRFRLDYLRRKLTFDKDDAEAPPTFLRGETVLAVLPFETRKRPNDPFITVSLGGHSFVAAFDTGQPGLLELSDSMRDDLQKGGAIVPLVEKDKDGDTLYQVKNLEIAPNFVVNLPGVTIQHPGSIVDKGIGISEPSSVFLGSQFLSQFKTVWDFPNHKIYVLQP